MACPPLLHCGALATQRRFALSLSDLANAFQEMGNNHATLETSITASQSLRRESDRRSYSAETEVSQDNDGSSSNQRWSHSGALAPLLTLQTTYVDHLFSLSLPHLTIEVEEQLRRRHLGCMVLCVVEAERRTTLLQEDLTDDGRLKLMSFYNDGYALLTAMLHCVARVEFTSVDEELTAWIGTTSSSIRPPASFAYALSQCLLRWLYATASRYTALEALSLIHLLSQQKLCYSEAVLETLMDTVVLQLHPSSAGDGGIGSEGVNPTTASYALVETASAVNSPLLPEYAYLLDAMLRFQRDIQNAISRQSYVAAPHHSRGGGGKNNASDVNDIAAPSLSSLQEGGSSTATVQRRALQSASHPVANAVNYGAVAEGLITLLRQPQGRVCSRSLESLSSASFFFLTRALSKLAWFHPQLISVLLPHLTTYLRHHPETFLGVVFLLGRRENTTMTAEMMDLIQKAVIAQLRRHSAPMEGKSTTASSHCDGSATRAEKTTMTLAEAELSSVDPFDTEGPVVLFSDASGDAAAEATSQQHFTSPIATTASSPSSPPTSPFQMTSIDFNILPLFLESMQHAYRLAIATASPTDVAEPHRMPPRPHLQAQAQLLRELLLDDLHRSVTAVAEIARTIPMTLLTRLLVLLLQLQGECGAADADTATSSPSSEISHSQPQHPFMVELAYSWVMEISHSKRLKRLSYHISSASVPQQQQLHQVLDLHRLLLRSGLICQVTSPKYPQDKLVRCLIPKETLEAAPRVAAALHSEMSRLNALKKQRERRSSATSFARQEAAAPVRQSDVFKPYSKLLMRIGA